MKCPEDPSSKRNDGDALSSLFIGFIGPAATCSRVKTACSAARRYDNAASTLHLAAFDAGGGIDGNHGGQGV
jgi:hypothetical protein